MVKRSSALAVAFAVTMTLAATALGRGDATPNGGIFRISLSVQAGVDNLDPALSFTAAGWALLDTTCARLMSYPDKAPPDGLRVVPEVAAAAPTVSRDLKTFTFRLRKGFRFSDGQPVRASAFARAINRVLAPSMKSPGAYFARGIEGADDVLAGRRQSASGVRASGNTLTIRFLRATPGFAALTTLPFFCAVPPSLPLDPEGIGTIPSAGPYRVTEYRPGERVALRRNPFYGGRRPHHVDGFDVDLRTPSPAEMVRRIERGEADWGQSLAPIFLDPALGLVATYGINKSRFFLKPGLTLRMFALNSSRPLFKQNPGLRRAVNLALDRQALQAIGGGPLSGRVTDQFIPPVVPGFRNANIYPLFGADLTRAREEAQDNLRDGKAVFYASDFSFPLAVAQLAKRQLAEIGLEVEIKPFPIHTASAAYLETLARAGEPWDIALVVWSPNVADPQAYINFLLDSQHVGATNVAAYSSRIFDRAMRRAARTTHSLDRQRAYGTLDARIAREAAPLAALSVLNEATFVSERVGCIVLRPSLDLTSVCLK